MARLDRLGSAEEVVQIGAVIGREFSTPFWPQSRASRRQKWHGRSTVSWPPACCFGKAFRLMRAICSSTHWCKMPHTARCCASRAGYFTHASRKSSRASSVISPRTSQNCWRVIARTPVSTRKPSLHLAYLSKAKAELGQVDDARRHLSEAMSVIKTTKDKWFEAEVYRRAGDVALLTPLPDNESRSVFRACTRRLESAASKIIRTPRLHKPRAALARPGQGAASSRTAGSGVRVVHRRVRHARSEGGEGAAEELNVT
jgi:hypothetical protein